MIAVTSLASVPGHPAVISALCAAPLILMGMLAIGRWLKRNRDIPLGVMFRLFALALAAYVPLRVIEAVRTGEADDWWSGEGIRSFEAVLVLLAIVFGLQLLRRFYWQRWFVRRHGTEAPKLLQQVFGFALFCAALALVLKVAYGFQVNTFLAGSGIAAVVIGLAMQETLANIVSGIVLQIGKPFKVGDWLIIGQHRAEVIEVNWRSTKLRTNDDVYLDIPNKAVVSATITNLSYPTKNHANRIRVGFGYDAPPNTVREVLRRAAASAPGVADTPPAKVFLREFGDSALIYEIKYSLEDESRYNDIENAIRTNIWYEARRAGLTIPYPTRTVHIQRPAGDAGKATEVARELLPTQELLSPLDGRQKEWLIEHAKILRFGGGEKIIRQGSEGCSMFIIVRGEVDVVVHASGSDTVVATLHPGEAFGEMCLLTGEARSATVVAKTDCDLWEIDRAVLQPLIQGNPGLAERLGGMLARRKMETDGILALKASAAAVEEKHQEITTSLRRRIAALFEI